MMNLDYYLNHDHAARRTTTLLAVAVGAIVGTLLESLGTSTKVAAILCVAAIGTVETARAWRYVQPTKRKQVADSPSHIRRYLVFAPVSVLVFIAVALLPLPRIEAAVIERKLKENSDYPLDRQNMRDTTRTLIHAETSNIKLKPSVVEITGRKFVEASENSPDAWETAHQYLDYRSFLNADFVPLPTQLTPWKSSRYLMSTNFKPTPALPGTHRSHSVSFAGGYVSPENSARLEMLSNPQSETSGVGLFVIDGGIDIIVLDGMYMKNVIIRNSDVEYDGGPVRLEHVSLVNCNFHFQYSPLAIELVKAILASPIVNFSATQSQ